MNPLVALVGQPNVGKTALFNLLTGTHQKVANYPGVTVEKKEGFFETLSGQKFRLLDLPGTVTLDAKSLDEFVTRDVILGKHEEYPELFVVALDSTNLERSLSLVLELKELNLPMIVALNMMDLALARGLKLDIKKLQEILEIPVVSSVAIKKEGISDLLIAIEKYFFYKNQNLSHSNNSPFSPPTIEWKEPTRTQLKIRYEKVDEILSQVIQTWTSPSWWTEKLDNWFLHPVFGGLTLFFVLALMFQAIFSWAELPMTWIENGIEFLATTTASYLENSPLKSLVVDGIISGVGAVLVFLPQILLLFFFILILEGSGYMARAAFMMDRIMSRVGLNGRAIIPLLSSYACAIPGIMSARTIVNRRDRLTTIMIAPLTTCSARLPVYTLLIGAFIPQKTIGGFFNLQGLVMLVLYLTGITFALLSGFVFKKTLLKGDASYLLMELPTYKWPTIRNIIFGLWQRARIFLKRAGTLILGVTVVLWFLVTYPKPPVGTDEPAINYSFAGKIGKSIEPVLKPLGFDWHIAAGLIPGLAAREVMVSALATVYSVENENETTLAKRLYQNWSLPTALSLLAWYIFAPQCLATLVVVKRETNSWRWPGFMFVYMMTLAYLASFVTYRISLMFT